MHGTVPGYIGDAPSYGVLAALLQCHFRVGVYSHRIAAYALRPYLVLHAFAGPGGIGAAGGSVRVLDRGRIKSEPVHVGEHGTDLYTCDIEPAAALRFEFAYGRRGGVDVEPKMCGIAPLIIDVTGSDVEVPRTVLEARELAQLRPRDTAVEIVEDLARLCVLRRIHQVRVALYLRFLVWRFPLEQGGCAVVIYRLVLMGRGCDDDVRRALEVVIDRIVVIHRDYAGAVAKPHHDLLETVAVG